MNRKILKDAAQEYLSMGFSILPLAFPDPNPKSKRNKVPTTEWIPLQTAAMSSEEAERLFSKNAAQGVGIVCGAISGDLEVLDVDAKHDDTGTLWGELLEMLHEYLPAHTDKFLIVRSINNGYHIYYRISGESDEASPRSNQNLAWRVNPGVKNEKLIETRGEGGYIVAPPSPGYEVIQGSYDSIPTLTADEREMVISISCSFNQEVEEKPRQYSAAQGGKRSSGLRSWEDYNEQERLSGGALTLNLLQARGWKLRDRGSKVVVQYPGASNPVSGNYSRIYNSLYMHSHKAEIPHGHQSPSAVYAFLECGGDFSRAAKDLYEKNYGERKTRSEGNGGGYDYMAADTFRAPVSVRAEGLRIDVETREAGTITLDGGAPLTQGSVRALNPVKVKVYHTPETDRDETIQAVRLLDRLAPVYVGEVFSLDTLDGLQEEGLSAAWRYLYHAIRSPYEGLSAAQGDLTDEQRDDLLREFLETSTGLARRTDSDKFIAELSSDDDLLAMGVTPATLKSTADELRAQNRAKDKERALRDLHGEIGELLEKRNVPKAMEAMQDGLQDLRKKSGEELARAFRSWDEIEESLSSAKPGNSTGYRILDEFVRFSPGTLSLIGGRTSHGKTALLLNLALRQAMEAEQRGGSIIYVTLEEPAWRLGAKAVNILQGEELSRFCIPGEHPTMNYPRLLQFYQRQPSSSEAGKRADERLAAHIREHRATMKRLNDSAAFLFADQSRCSLPAEAVRDLVLDKAETLNVEAVFVDYIQCMRTTTKTQDKRTEVGHIADVLLNTAISTGIPLIVGAQFSREAEKSGGGPSSTHLKEAGDLEEDANTVLAIVNPHMAEKDQDKRALLSKERYASLEITATKNREGEAHRTVNLTLDKWTQRITEDAAPSPRSGNSSPW